LPQSVLRVGKLNFYALSIDLSIPQKWDFSLYIPEEIVHYIPEPVPGNTE
jgi:hypothetical protein